MSKIFLEARSLSTTGGGVRTYTLEVIKELIRLNSGHELHVVYDSAAHKNTFSATEHVVPIWHKSARIYWDFFRLPPYLKKERADLIHYFKPATSPFLSMPAIAIIYDVIPLTHPETQTLAQRMYWKVQLPLVAKKCRHIVTISEDSKRNIAERLKVAPEKITVAYPAAGEKFSPRSEEETAAVKEKYNLPQSFMLFLGTIEPKKNVANIVRAAAQTPYYLVIAGKWGWKYDDVKRAMAESNMGERLKILPYIDGDDLPVLLSAADVFVFPSIYEGFGLPPLEAMACGTPVITSLRSSLPEVVGEHGLLVDPDNPDEIAESMRKLMDNVDLRNKLGRESAVWARRFKWEDAAKKVLGVYEKILSNV